MKAKMFCYACRKEFGEMPKMPQPVVYDFCPDCQSLMAYDIERQMKGLPALPLTTLKEIRKARRTDKIKAP